MTFVSFTVFGCTVKVATESDGKLQRWGMLTGPKGSRVVHCVNGKWEVKEAALELGGTVPAQPVETAVATG